MRVRAGIQIEMKSPFNVLGWIGLVAITGMAEAGEPAVHANGKGVPKIQFATNFFDFGKITTGEKFSA